MISVDYSLIIVILNFVLLIIVLKKLLYKPITVFLAERQKQINDDLKNAKDANSEAQQKRESAGEELKEAHMKSRKIVESAEDIASAEAHTIINQAKEKEAQIIAETQSQLAIERQKAVQSLGGDIATMVASLTERLIDEKMDAKKDKDFIEKAIQKRGLK